MDVTVRVKWNEDADSAKIYRPSNMTIMLYHRYAMECGPLNRQFPNLSADNDWTYTWKDLEYGDYTVLEIPDKGDFFEPAVITEIRDTEIDGNIICRNFTLEKSMKPAEINISMKVAGKEAEPDREWEFSIQGLGSHVCRYSKHRTGFDEIEDSQYDHESGILIDGESFTLKHGESITLSDIPISVARECTINWEKNSQGYDTTCVEGGVIGRRTYDEKDSPSLNIDFIDSSCSTFSVEVTKHRDTIPDAKPECKCKKKIVSLGLICAGLFLVAAAKSQGCCFREEK